MAVGELLNLSNFPAILVELAENQSGLVRESAC